MRKILKISLSLLCLCPLALCACQSNDYYKITAISSSSALGSVSGYNSNKTAEGTTITLVARENDAENHSLLGWVKNNEYLVKIAPILENNETDNKLSLVAGSDTEGKYTAVFDEDENSMMYAYLYDFSLNLNGGVVEPENYELSISYSILSAGSDNYLPYEYRFVEGMNTNIIYFGSLGNNYEYKFKIQVTFDVSDGKKGVTLFSDVISKENFPSEAFNLNFSYEDEIEKEGIFSMSINKFSPALREIIPETPVEE